MRLRLPQERPSRPPIGYKLAHPVLSHDGTRTGFAGVSIGGALPYGFLDDAHCVYGRRHRPPAPRCDCGFYCLHDRDEALALACATEYRRAVLLEVGVLGAYIRFERGMRYARQRVREVRVGACACGRASAGFVDAGWGRPGWRVLSAACAGCAVGRAGAGFAPRTVLGFAEFVRLGGGRVRVVNGAGGAEVAGAGASYERPVDGATASTVPELVAEASLLQVRLDWLQGQLARLTGKAPDVGEGGGGAEAR
ncbi:hypothetical protein [Streptomyces sp. NPDC003077]|uniref:hypothetical protein n=1 Tax=Streptomyces sp. NPDC003077 TaxID=3154443 RepID=UPI0033BADC31